MTNEDEVMRHFRWMKENMDRKSMRESIDAIESAYRAKCEEVEELKKKAEHNPQADFWKVSSDLSKTKVEVEELKKERDIWCHQTKVELGIQRRLRSALDEAVKALERYRRSGGIQHTYNCDISLSPIGSKECSCGCAAIFLALARIRGMVK